MIKRVGAILIAVFIVFTATIPVMAQVKEINYQVEGNYPPFKFSNNGQFSGFDIELSSLIFNSNDYRLIYSMDSWERVYSNLKNRKIDTCGLVAVTEKRKQEILFSNTVLKSYLALYKKDILKKLSLDNLSDYKIAVAREQYSEKILKDIIGIKKYYVYDTVVETIDALNSGEVDLIFENQEVVNYYLIQKDLIGIIKPELSSLYPVEVAFGISRDKPELLNYVNMRLEKLQKSGAYEELYQKYFTSHSEFYTQMNRKRLIVGSAIGLAIVLSAILILQQYIGFLRKRILSVNNELLVQKNFLDSIVDNANIMINVMDMEGNLIKYNRFSEQQTGFREEEVIGKKWYDVMIPEEIRGDMIEAYEKIKQGELAVNHENSVLCKNGQQIDVLWNNNLLYDEHGNPVMVVATGVDITARKSAVKKLIESYEVLEATHEELAATEEELKSNYDELQKSKEELHKIAYFDSLTGLPNRVLLMDRLSMVLAESKRSKQMGALLYLDLDNFKTINDTQGHDFGDELLKRIAEKLKGCIREYDTVARLGGDEFVILQPRINCVDDAVSMADRIVRNILEPWIINEREFYITCSIGITLYPNDGKDSPTILKNADTAVYRAKELGRNNYQLYEKSMNDRILEKMEIESHLRRALERNEFVLFYQPQVDMKTGNIVGIEALVRWQHPEKGMIPPVKFIPLAEETGLIIPIGEWVLRTACIQSNKWREAGITNLHMAVNLSARQFQQKDITEMIRRILSETGMPPELLELEITESIAMHDLAHTISVLKGLKEMGIRISLDDFGTGYSSLNYLKNLPINTLKIDKHFVQEITMNPNEEAIAKAVILMAHSMLLSVTAEGVETEEQLNFLKKQNCDKVQGYLFSKPLPAEEIELILRQEKMF